MQKSMRRLIIQIFAAPAVVGISFCQSATLFADEVQVDDIPRSGVPLPAVDHDAEKPWSERDFAASEFRKPEWQIGLRYPVSGAEKPASTQISGLTTQPIANHGQVDSPGKVGLRPEIEESSHSSDSESDAAESDEPVARIVWTTETSAKAADESLQPIPIGAISMIDTGENGSGAAEPHTASSHWAAPGSLRHLKGDSISTEPSSGHYLEALQQLLGRSPENWLHVTPEGSETEFAVSQNSKVPPTYVDELQRLRNRIILTEAAIDENSVPQAPEIPAIGTTENPTPQTQPTKLPFASLSEIRLKGPDAIDDEQIAENAPEAGGEKAKYSNGVETKAGKYSTLTRPLHYRAMGPFASPRPNRNTQPFYYNPLYFEETNLERCGESHGCLTTAASAVHFAANLTLLPYHMAVECPDSCVESPPDCPTYHRFE